MLISKMQSFFGGRTKLLSYKNNVLGRPSNKEWAYKICRTKKKTRKNNTRINNLNIFFKYCGINKKIYIYVDEGTF